MSTVQSPEQVQAEWLDRLNHLIDDVKTWAEELDWSTRRIEITMEESPIGKYKAPALLLQQEALKMLLEPIGSSTIGSQGRVDLYIMPAFDDIATICYIDGVWQVYYMFPGLLPDKELHDEPTKPLSKETLQEVLREMKKMLGKRFNQIIQIKDVEVEYIAVRFAVNRLLGDARNNPLVLKNVFKPQDLEDASNHLEDTYIVRLFAEFETGLRSYWSTLKSSIPQTRDLLDSIRACRQIPAEQIINVHRVRLWRNAIVHERGEEAERVPIDFARHYLCRYFSYLPPNW